MDQSIVASGVGPYHSKVVGGYPMLPGSHSLLTELMDHSDA
jgi:hypothetical protein